ncbi:MAG TPA: chemotaxis protein, partial [Desulfuromonadales bacterium]|nr:chemotaxis protein [Desulfuromonadales bacterium]
KTAELVQEISAASREQESGSEQISQSILQLDKVTQHNASSSEELAAVAEELSSQVEHMQTMVSVFRIDDRTAYADLDPKAMEGRGNKTSLTVLSGEDSKAVPKKEQRPVSSGSDIEDEMFEQF